MTQINAPATNCLTINLLSFEIPPKYILQTDQLIVKAKTFPDGNKQKYEIKAKKMNNCNLVFKFNITNQTQKVHLNIQKKTFLSGNHIIGTSDLDITDLPKSTSDQNTPINKTLDIYYPVKRQLREQQPHGANRSSITEKVIGQMKIGLWLSDPLDSINDKTNKSKKTSLKANS